VSHVAKSSGDSIGDVVAEVEVIQLSREAQEQFVSMLLNPPPPSPAPLRALELRHTLIAK
jgi:hypothetical protein